MSRTTLQNTLTELYGLLASDANGTPRTSLATAGCAKVYDREPGAGGWVKPASITMFPSGLEPTEWTVDLRVYVDNQYGERAQDLLVDVTVAADVLLAAGAGYGPSRWDMGWSPDLDCWVSTCTLQVGREDGF